MVARYEKAVRPADKQWDEWHDAHIDKIRTTLAAFDERASALADRFDIGTIALTCALSYLDFRFAHLGWRDDYPALARWQVAVSERPSLRATVPN